MQDKIRPVNWVGPDQHLAPLEDTSPTPSSPQAVRAGRDAHVRTDREVFVTLGSSYPNTLERVLMVVRNVLAIIVLLGVLVAGAAVWGTIAALSDRASTPSVTSICDEEPTLC